MTISSKAWREGMLAKTTNIASGFKSAGLWPLRFPATQHRLTLFKEGGILLSDVNPTWVRCRGTV